MALDNIIYTGEDIELEFSLFDSDNAPINIQYTQALLVRLYHEEDDIQLATYGTNPNPGVNTNDLVVSDPATNNFIIRLQAEVTRQALPGMNLLVEVKVRYANANYSNNDFDTIASGVIVGQLVKSQTGNIQNM